MSKRISKKIKKTVDGKCYFCDEDDYDLLDCHRIKPGAEGGKYTEHNVLTVCASCHRKCHSGRIEILGRHFTTAGSYILHYKEDGEEKWKWPK